MTNTSDISPSKSARLARRASLAGLVGTVAVMAGCATVANPTPGDPWESYNRGMFAFNDAFDKALLKPIASGYEQIVPQPARSCVNNIFGNLADAWSAVNSFFQGRGHDFFNSLGRVLFNSTVGLGGCIDVASMHGAERINNDFGTTLGVWGVGTGPYFVLPFIGPSTVRDTTAFVGTLAADVSPFTPVMSIDNVALRNSLIGLFVVDTRASLLTTDKLVEDVALDRYSFIRDAYLQRRQALVNGRSNSAAAERDADVLPDYTDF